MEISLDHLQRYWHQGTKGAGRDFGYYGALGAGREADDWHTD